MVSEDSHSQDSHERKQRRASVGVAPGDAPVAIGFGASAHDPVANHALGYQADIVPDQDDGVTKIEALYLVFSGWKIWILYISIAFMCYTTSLSGNTTFVYEPFSTSAYGAHSLIGTIAVAVSIIGGIAKPFIAKIADVASRPTAFAICLGFYVIGYIIIAASSTVNAVAAGQVLAAVGNTGMDIMTTILIGDITSLQWRGLATAVSASPYVINAFIAGEITSQITLGGWRWGYGMFTIIMPVAMAPLLFVLFWANAKAKRIGTLSLSASQYSRRQELAGLRKRSPLQMALYYIKVIDALGLLLLGFGVALLLLPLTLYTRVQDNWKNPSIIAMFVCGGIILISFAVWERFFSPHPIMPARLWNRTMWCCIAIDLLYYFSYYLGAGYLSSWVYVVKYEWSTKDYTYWSNALGLSLTVFAVMAGALQRYFHNYKYIQLTGLCIRVIGMALLFYAAQGHTTTAVFVSAQVVAGMGGAMSVIGSQVAVQASVPHQDMGLASANLALWTSVGGAIGNAIAAAMWNDRLPKNIDKYLSPYYNATERAEIFGSIVVAQLAEPKDLVEEAYNQTQWLMSLLGLILTILPIIPGLLTSNFYLGTSHNAIEPEKLVIARLKGETEDQFIARGMAHNEQRAEGAQDNNEGKEEKTAERSS